jgi:diadenosine tetraphosphate (Ap4A) HIT family hydrolase
MEIKVDDCTFCYPDEDLEQRAIERKDGMLSFFSKPRFRRHHILVVPEDHYEDIDEVPTDTMGRLMGKAALLADLIDYGYGTIKLQKTQLLLGANGIRMKHLHVHVWPITKQDVRNDILVPAPQSVDDFHIPTTAKEMDALDEDIALTRRELQIIELQRQGVEWPEIQRRFNQK